MNTYTYRKRLYMWHDHGITRNSARRGARMEPFPRALLSALPVWELTARAFIRLWSADHPISYIPEITPKPLTTRRSISSLLILRHSHPARFGMCDSLSSFSYRLRSCLGIVPRPGVKRLFPRISHCSRSTERCAGYFELMESYEILTMYNR